MFRLRGFSPPCRFTPRTVCRFVAPCSQSWASLRLARRMAPHRRPTDRSLSSATRRPSRGTVSVLCGIKRSPSSQRITLRSFSLISSCSASPRRFALLLLPGPLPLPPPERPSRTEVHIKSSRDSRSSPKRFTRARCRRNTCQPKLTTVRIRRPDRRKGRAPTIKSHCAPSQPEGRYDPSQCRSVGPSPRVRRSEHR